MGEALNGFERLLGNDGSPWFEHNLELAGEALNEFSSAEWRNLQSRVLSFSACVQERCTEAVGAFGKSDGIGVLTTLLVSSPHFDVAVIAASQLDDMETALPASLRGRLQAILDQLTARRSTRAGDVQRLLSHLC